MLRLAGCSLSEWNALAADCIIKRQASALERGMHMLIVHDHDFDDAVADRERAGDRKQRDIQRMDGVDSALMAFIEVNVAVSRVECYLSDEVPLPGRIRLRTSSAFIVFRTLASWRSLRMSRVASSCLVVSIATERFRISFIAVK